MKFGILVCGAALALAAGVASTPAAAATATSSKPAASSAPGSCEARHMVTAADGTCKPKIGRRRGFHLVTAADANAPASSSKPASSGGGRPH